MEQPKENWEEFTEKAARYILKALGQYFEKPMGWNFKIAEADGSFEVKVTREVRFKVRIQKRIWITAREVEAGDSGPVREKIKDLYDQAQHTLALRMS